MPAGTEAQAALTASRARIVAAGDQTRRRVGLRSALRALARRSAVPVRVDVRTAGRMPEPVEIAAYFAVFEALTYTAKHARASAAEVEVATGEGVLRVRVSDDGCGGADVSHGSGLAGLKDRVEAFGGRISLHSPPGAGTAPESSCPSTSRPGPSHRDLDAAVGMRITKTR